MSEVIRIHTAADGSVILGPSSSPGGPAGVGLLVFPGATAVINPLATIPHLVIHEVDAASDLVVALYGNRAGALLGQPDGSHVTAPTETAGLVQHLGRIAWLRDVRPLPLDPQLLDLEFRASLAELPWPLAADGAPLTADESRVMDDLTGLQALGPGPSESGESATLEALTIRAAAHLGSGPHQGTASLDWARVPDRLVPSPEDTVSFMLAEPDDPGDGTGVLTVEVLMPPATILHPAVTHPEPAPTRLLASLTVSGWPLPLASGPLVTVDGRQRGTIAVGPEAMALVRQARSLSVDIRAVHLPWVPPTSGRAQRAAARRWAARGWAFLVLAAWLGTPSLESMARDGLRFAQRLWAGLDDEHADQCAAAAAAPAPTIPLTLAEAWFARHLSGPS